MFDQDFLSCALWTPVVLHIQNVDNDDDEMMRGIEHVMQCCIPAVLGNTDRSLTASTFARSIALLLWLLSGRQWVGEVPSTPPADAPPWPWFLKETDRNWGTSSLAMIRALVSTCCPSIYIPRDSMMQLVAPSRRCGVLRLCGRVLAKSQRRCNLRGSKAHSRSFVVLQRREMSHQATGHMRCDAVLADSAKCLWLT